MGGKPSLRVRARVRDTFFIELKLTEQIVATAKIFPVYCEVIAARGVCLEASTTCVTSRTRFHLENAEHARIIAAIAAMPDWFDAPVMTGQE